MLLIPLMLATTPAPAVEPAVVQRPEAARSHPTRPVIRSQRLVELEAAVRSLSRSTAQPRHGAGPQDM
ncbi:MAG TPA: hypothetical protein VFZ91_14110 [Allosphingosinicella sp.]